MRRGNKSTRSQYIIIRSQITKKRTHEVRCPKKKNLFLNISRFYFSKKLFSRFLPDTLLSEKENKKQQQIKGVYTHTHIHTLIGSRTFLQYGSSRKLNSSNALQPCTPRKRQPVGIERKFWPELIDCRISDKVLNKESGTFWHFSLTGVSVLCVNIETSYMAAE